MAKPISTFIRRCRSRNQHEQALREKLLAELVELDEAA